ncbi:MAG TPA: D-glucuronyl C5-epimerase family protein, partial [Anaerolineales bacterium]
MLADYPFRWEAGADDFDYPLDASGVPLVQMGKPHGLRYNAITTSQFGLHNLQRFSEARDEPFLNHARNCVRWLFANFKPWRESIGGWIYDYSLPFYGPNAPWISGMAQGEAISLLLRFHQIEPSEATERVTASALQAFFFPVADGGVVSAFPDGGLVFEEYPTGPPSQVLNGHIFALLGILDYAAFFQHKAAGDLFDVA